MSKFKIKDERSFKQKTKDFGLSMLFWKGRKKGIIHTRDIKWSDIGEILFPKDDNEKYSYLGYIYVSKGTPERPSAYYNSIMEVVLAMDKKAKPVWCPRWFLRFLHVFGSDKSIVRVRNFPLHNLLRKLTKGYVFWDWKTKWDWYDLRISITGDRELNELVSRIERDFYKKGKSEETES